MSVTREEIVRAVIALSLGFLVVAKPLPAMADTTSASIQAVQALIDAERFEKAVEALKTLDAQGSVPAGQISLMMGRIYLGLSKPAKALEFFERASFSSLDTEADARLGLAEANLALGNLAKARSEAEWALKSDPDIVAAHLVLARIDQRLGRTVEALERLGALQTARPDSEDVAILFARFHALDSGPARAASELRRFLGSHPASATARDYLGHVLWAAGENEEAIDARRHARNLYSQRGQAGRAEAMTAWLRAVAPETERRVETARSEPPPPPNAQPRPSIEVSLLPPPPKARVVRAAVLPKPEPLPFPPGSPIMTGSGVVLEGGRSIITNRHVVEDMQAIAVRNGIGHVRSARVVKVSQEDDLALLEIDSPFPDGAAMPVSEIVEPAPGRSAIVMGYPLIGVLGDEQPALTEGIVAKAAGLANDPGTFQMTAKLNKGNSGGPVFDRRGYLIGVAVGKMDTAEIRKTSGTPVEDINFGIKASRVLRFLGKPMVAGNPRQPELALEDLYQQMLPRAVLVAAQK